MKNFYLSLIICLFSSSLFAQVELVMPKPYGGYGLEPTILIASTDYLAMYGMQGYSGRAIVYNPHVFDGTNFNAAEIRSGGPSYATLPFVLNNSIYYKAAVDGRTYATYLVDATGATKVGDWFMEAEQYFISEGKVVFMAKEAASGQKLLFSWDGNAANSPVLLPNQLDGNNLPLYTFGGGVIKDGDKYLMSAKPAVNGVIGTHYELGLFDPATGYSTVKDLYPSYDFSVPKSFTKVGNEIYFTAASAQNVLRIWKTDLTTDGTVEVVGINDALKADHTCGILGAFNNKLLIKGTKVGETDKKLFVYDPADEQAGLQVVKMNDGTTDLKVSFNPWDKVVEHNNKAFFAGIDGTDGLKYLYSFNGQLTADKVDENVQSVNYPTAYKGKLYMQAMSAGSGGRKELFVYDNMTTALEPAATAANAIEVYPNPSNGQLFVNGLKGNNATYEIFDLTGASVAKGLVSNNSIVYHLEAGVYLLKVLGSDNQYIKKIIVQ
ncbi:T9SS type A sorting domain-containing protein [Carboxylicivirga taeanensis]|uniref:T9SS type A sorting domain-containing protein n=1 Tax=Carboxylicivirga taeanensis TaxID=1416875 RepID=UPI003F6DEBE9